MLSKDRVAESSYGSNMMVHAGSGTVVDDFGLIAIDAENLSSVAMHVGALALGPLCCVRPVIRHDAASADVHDKHTPAASSSPAPSSRARGSRTPQALQLSAATCIKT